MCGWSERLWGSLFSVHHSAPREEGKARLQGPCCPPGPAGVSPAESWTPRGKRRPGAGRTEHVRAGSAGGRAGDEKVSSSQPIGRTEKQDIVTRRGRGRAGAGGAEDRSLGPGGAAPRGRARA